MFDSYSLYTPVLCLMMKTNFSIGSWNIQGLGGKTEDEQFVSCLKYDINILLETWKGSDSNSNIEHFKILQKSRKKKLRSKRFSGGIIIYYKSNLHKGISEVNNVTKSENRLWFKLDKFFFGFKKDLYVCACYVPPLSSSYYNEDFILLENEISKLSSKGNILVIGDLNARVSDHLDFINYENNINHELNNLLPDNYIGDIHINRNSLDKVFNPQGKQLIDLCVASQLRILNGRFIGDWLGNLTCFKHNGASTVDYALSDLDLMSSIDYFHIGEPSYLSDHVQISVIIKCNINQDVRQERKDFVPIENRYKWGETSKRKLLDALADESVINKIVNFEDSQYDKTPSGIDQATHDLNEIFENLATKSCKSIKFKKVKSKRLNKKPWADNEIRELKKTINIYGDKLRKNPFDLNIKNTFYKHCKELKKLVKKKKILFKKDLFEKLTVLQESDPQKYWELLKTLKHEDCKQNEGSNIDLENFENHFQNLGKASKFDVNFENKVNSDLSTQEGTLSQNNVTDCPFSVSEIKKCIKELKMGKSSGPDLIANEILKYSSVVTIKAIVKLFNLIFSSSSYPTSWRNAFIVLIHKKGDKTDIANYRSISLLNCLAKLYSSVLNKRLIEHYENRFSCYQFGFRSNHRTSDSIFILKTLITKFLKKQKQKLFACFVDLKSAFDSVWHNGLLYKLINDNIGEKMYKTIKNMYTLCQSSLKIGNEHSIFFPIYRGVRQGDSLSPTLFNCFINDLNTIFDNTCDPPILDASSIQSLSYADDLVILSKSHQGLQNSLNKLHHYCYKWQLTVNANKTKVMVFQNRYQETKPFSYDGNNLSEVKDFKFLGNIINSCGNFTKTSEELSKKGIKVLFLLRNYMSNFNFVPTNLSCKLFDSLIRPILTYNSEIWFMDNFITTFRAENRAESNNTNCDVLSLAEKYSFEKVHSKFCKAVLGLKKTASNIGARTELGRFTLDSYIKHQSLMYYYRVNSNNVNPLVYEALEVNKKLHNEGVYSWYSYVDKISKDMEINSDSLNSTKNIFKCNSKKLILEKYEKITIKKISKFDSSSKLFLYGKIKPNCNSECYLKHNNFTYRKLISKFRLSDHSLGIETGRYMKIPREQRLCKNCKILDDEKHFFFDCEINSTLRADFLNKFKDHSSTFENLDQTNKLINILSPTPELVCHTGVFIKQSLELRASDPSQTGS